jgi:hypothetical protein
MTVAAAGPTLASFDAQPWWMVVLKAAFLLLTTMFMLGAYLGRDGTLAGPGVAAQNHQPRFLAADPHPAYRSGH